MQELDRRFTRQEADRIAACVSYLGKRPGGVGSLGPEAVMEA